MTFQPGMPRRHHSRKNPVSIRRQALSGTVVVRGKDYRLLSCYHLMEAVEGRQKTADCRACALNARADRAQMETMRTAVKLAEHRRHEEAADLKDKLEFAFEVLAQLPALDRWPELRAAGTALADIVFNLASKISQLPADQAAEFGDRAVLHEAQQRWDDLLRLATELQPEGEASHEERQLGTYDRLMALEDKLHRILRLALRGMEKVKALTVYEQDSRARLALREIITDLQPKAG